MVHNSCSRRAPDHQQERRRTGFLLSGYPGIFSGFLAGTIEIHRYDRGWASSRSSPHHSIRTGLAAVTHGSQILGVFRDTPAEGRSVNRRNRSLDVEESVISTEDPGLWGPTRTRILASFPPMVAGLPGPRRLSRAGRFRAGRADRAATRAPSTAICWSGLHDRDAASELDQEFALRFLRGDFHRADPRAAGSATS